MNATTSRELAKRFFPNVPIPSDLSDHRSFFTAAKAERVLGWVHDIAALLKTHLDVTTLS